MNIAISMKELIANQQIEIESLKAEISQHAEAIRQGYVMTEKQYRDLLITVRTFLFDLDQALRIEQDTMNESNQKLIMTNGMWLQIEAMRNCLNNYP